MTITENMYKVALGANIRKIRKKIKLTQDAFSEKIGIEPSSLSNIENGKSFPSTYTIIQIQKQFNISAQDIFDIEFLNDVNSFEQDFQRTLENLNFSKKSALYKIAKILDC